MTVEGSDRPSTVSASYMKSLLDPRLRFGRSSSTWTQLSWSTISRCWGLLRAASGSLPLSRFGFDGAPAWPACMGRASRAASRYRVKTYHHCFNPTKRDLSPKDVPPPAEPEEGHRISACAQALEAPAWVSGRMQAPTRAVFLSVQPRHSPVARALPR